MIDVGHLFPGTKEGVYLDTASMALGNRPAVEAWGTALEQWQRGTFDWVEAEAVGEQLRDTIASLLGASADDIAFVTGAAGGAATVAAQLPDGTAGANIVVPTREFASNFVAWHLLQERGYELRLVDDVAGELPPDAFAALVDTRTAVIATSLVQSATGYRVDIDALKSLAGDAGAWLVVDGSQGFGAVDFDVDGVDALFSCSHKWLLGVRGIGHLYVRQELRDTFRPITPGWKSTAEPTTTFYGPEVELGTTAAKLDASSPWFDAIANIEGARLLHDIGIGAVEEHDMALVDRLESHGLEVPFPRANRSPIVSLDVHDTDELVGRLEADNIKAAARSGKLRVSVHLYNTGDDIDRLVAALRGPS